MLFVFLKFDDVNFHKLFSFYIDTDGPLVWPINITHLQFLRDDTHITSMKTIQFLRPPPPKPPLSIYVQISFTPLTLDVHFLTKSPSPPPTHTHTHTLQMIINHWKGNIIPGWLCVISSLILSGFPFPLTLLLLLIFLKNTNHGFNSKSIQKYE